MAVFELKEPDLIVPFNAKPGAREASKYLTGLMKYEHIPGRWAYMWFEHGRYHKELGPSLLEIQTNHHIYYCNHVHMSPMAYWKIMFEKYKGTEHEGICLVEILLCERKF